MIMLVFVYCDFGIGKYGLFVLYYLYKLNLFFIEFEFKGYIRQEVSKGGFILKVVGLGMFLRLICRYFEDFFWGGMGCRGQGKSRK